MEGHRELRGWEDIAGYLGVKPRAAQNYEKDRGLPVHRVPGSRGRVFAYTDELDAWRNERTWNNGVPLGSQTTGKTESEARFLSDAPLLQEGRATPLSPRSRARFVIVAAVFLLAVAVVGFAVYMRGQPKSVGPTHYTLEGSLLTVFDQNNQELWKYSLPGVPSPRGKIGHPEVYPRELFVDLDGDGKNEFLYVFYDYQPNANKMRHILYCFRSTGKVMWTLKTGRVITTALGQRFGGEFFINALNALRRPRPDGGRIVVGSIHNYGWPYQVVLLTAAGKMVSEYWHPGWMWRMQLADLDGDGNEEVLLGGVNNSYLDHNTDGLPYEATLVVLDSRHMNGQGPAIDNSWAFKGLPRADETAVLLFRRLERLEDRNEFFRVMYLSVDDNRRVTLRLGARTDPNGMIGTSALFDFDRTLKLVNVVPEANLGERLLRGLKPGASIVQRQAWIQEHIGKVKYLKNKLGVH